MIVDLLVRDGLALKPIRLNVSQVLVRQDNGTPISVAIEYGADNSQAVATVKDLPEFNRVLRVLGVAPVVCDVLELPQPPPGARLISGS